MSERVVLLTVESVPENDVRRMKMETQKFRKLVGSAPQEDYATHSKDQFALVLLIISTAYDFCIVLLA
jgi:hypothetical protein